MDEANLKFIADAINAHGIFFKKAVRKKLEELRLVKILDEEHPSSFPDQTAIDLLLECAGQKERFKAAVKAYKALGGSEKIRRHDQSDHEGLSGEHKYVVVTECKKAYAPYKKWIFFPDRTKNIKVAYHVGNNLYTHLKINPDGYGINVYSDGIEIDTLKLKKRGNTSFKSGNCDTIYGAASQVCKGLLGFLHARDSRSDPYVKYFGFGEFISFPLIITNATLYGCNNDYGDVNLETGNLESELQLEEIQWLLLRHPYADITSGNFRDFRTQEDKCMTPEDSTIFYKEPVFVLNSKYLEQFFTNCPIFYITLP